MITKRYPRPCETVHAPRVSKSYEIHPIVSTHHHREPVVARRPSFVRRARKNPKKKIVEAQSNQSPRERTCALRSNPPVDPPKIGLGVFGLSLGAVHGAGAAAAAAFSSARTTRAAPREEEDARRVVPRGVTMRTWEEVAERLNISFDGCFAMCRSESLRFGFRIGSSVCPRNCTCTYNVYI